MTRENEGFKESSRLLRQWEKARRQRDAAMKVAATKEAAFQIADEALMAHQQRLRQQGVEAATVDRPFQGLAAAPATIPDGELLTDDELQAQANAELAAQVPNPNRKIAFPNNPDPLSQRYGKKDATGHYLYDGLYRQDLAAAAAAKREAEQDAKGNQP